MVTEIIEDRIPVRYIENTEDIHVLEDITRPADPV
jgi:hypothetical protein